MLIEKHWRFVGLFTNQWLIQYPDKEKTPFPLGISVVASFLFTQQTNNYNFNNYYFMGSKTEYEL